MTDENENDDQDHCCEAVHVDELASRVFCVCR